MSPNAIGAAGMNTNVYPNYVYNTNQVSAQSLGRVDPIPQDALQGKVSYSNDLNQNPLAPGQSRDFNAIVESQMAEGERNASRIFGQDQMNAQNQMSTQNPAAPKDPAQDPSKSITEVTAMLNKESAPNADIMKVKDPAEKAVEELTTSPAEKAAQPKSVADQVAESNAPASAAEQENMSIAQMVSGMDQAANGQTSQAQGAGAADPAASQEPSAIPNVSLS